MSALEKAARALLGAMPTDDWDGSQASWEALDDDYRAYLTNSARAVLMAVQDAPISLLEEAAKQAYGADPLPHEVMNFDSAWTAMIDAILNEEPK